MASRGRDLTFSLLSDVSKFDTSAPERDLEELGRAAVDTGRDLDRLGDDSTAAARTIARSFDRIDDAARASSRKVDTETDDMRTSLRDVGQEAGDTAREVSASFTGSGSDILGGFQELAGQAGAALGPVGLAAGVAAAAGVGLITAEAEKLKQMTSDLVEEMIDAGGRLTEEALQARIQSMAAEDPTGFTKYNEQAREYGISIRDITRARAGDLEAMGRVRDALKKLDDAQAANREGAIAAQRGPVGPMQELRQELNLTTRAYEQAQDAVATATTATAAAVSEATLSTRTDWDSTRTALADPIHAKIEVKAPSQSQLDALNRGIRRGIGTIVVPLKPGQSKYANTTSNSRYRD